MPWQLTALCDKHLAMTPPAVLQFTTLIVLFSKRTDSQTSAEYTSRHAETSYTAHRDDAVHCIGYVQ